MANPEMYPLLQPNQADTGMARAHAAKINWETGSSYVESGLAVVLIKRGKYAFKLTRATSPQATDVRGESCRMSGAQKLSYRPLNIFEKAADGCRQAKVIVAGWRPAIRAYPEYSFCSSVMEK